ncbi:Diaminopimelate epimerase-like protein [Aaosphaeria arxii CBS 175.79]|uniref:Diaminopimelate epimerase-like protein n=1 Tax=Aaosphaeria arxii CBS 175.79 TaxID=1450172 RepID=A0A6A5YA66_9PLEO|nr:Diaminopimelate epimerase-like protein [Aaosphaeria arxii CBS 175.79]KAF2022239.1 Diaminopimelate epimerase-like protein [Aaosphaeria arxii CBS 175.79]
MELNFTTLDVFTETRFAGNPLGVVRVPASLRSKLTEDQKQKIASEFNLSEITFLHDVVPGESFANYDIFTPRSRMSFAGHPTIGTAIYICQHPTLFPDLRQIKTVAGLVSFEYDEAQKTVEVAIPHDVYLHKQKLLPHPYPEPSRNPTGESTVPLVSIVKGMAFNLVQLADLDSLALPTEGLLPFADLYKFEHLDPGSGWDVGYTGTFYFTDLGYQKNGEVSQRQLRTRSLGSREDPGTGSASAALCCYLTLIEEKSKGKGPFLYHLRQGVEMGRPCDIYVKVTRREDGEGIEEVKLKGGAVEVMEGIVHVD